MSKINLFFKGAKQGFRNFSHAITNLVNFVLLLIVYLFGIGLVSVISKIFRKHFLELKKTNSKSNWHEHKVTRQQLDKYYRMF